MCQLKKYPPQVRRMIREAIRRIKSTDDIVSEERAIVQAVVGAYDRGRSEMALKISSAIASSIERGGGR